MSRLGTLSIVKIVRMYLNLCVGKTMSGWQIEIQSLEIVCKCFVIDDFNTRGIVPFHP